MSTSTRANTVFLDRVESVIGHVTPSNHQMQDSYFAMLRYEQPGYKCLGQKIESKLVAG